MEQPQYKLFIPGLKESWDNGMIGFAAHPPIKRKTPCYLAEGCHDKEHIGWIDACGSGSHKWQLNFYRGNGGPNHYHCLYCGIANDLYQHETWGLLRVRRPKVLAHWIQDLEEDPRANNYVTR